ncbi:MAG TPA: hypothetical protein VFM18_00195, partial [Methanosarcina sp.]|nr:hypothetical protein [Methanosarcina sp.]
LAFFEVFFPVVEAADAADEGVTFGAGAHGFAGCLEGYQLSANRCQVSVDLESGAFAAGLLTGQQGVFKAQVVFEVGSLLDGGITFGSRGQAGYLIVHGKRGLG